MTAPRVRTWSSTLLAGFATFSLSAAAQPGPASSTAERVIAITGAPDEPSAVLYAAPDVPLAVRFDAPLRKDAAVTVQGADIRPHPFLPNALVITPSKSLADESPVPLLVPMAEGAIALKLAFSRTQRDASVRIVHRASPRATSQDELQELLSFLAARTLEPLTCSNADSTEIPRWVAQTSASGAQARVCSGGALVYVKVQVRADCSVAAAHLARGDESAEVLALRPAIKECVVSNACWLVVARAPRGNGRGFKLELLADDDAPCGGYTVDLKP